LLARGGIAEDEEVVGLALFEDRLDAVLFSVDREDQFAGRDSIGGHAEDVRDGDVAGRIEWLEARFDAPLRIDRKVVETLEILARLAAGVADAQSILVVALDDVERRRSA